MSEDLDDVCVLCAGQGEEGHISVKLAFIALSGVHTPVLKRENHLWHTLSMEGVQDWADHSPQCSQQRSLAPVDSHPFETVPGGRYDGMKPDFQA